MNQPLVSIIMPCYNDGQYIRQAVNSILKQTYTDWELVIIDDGSDDEKTIEVLKELHHKKIRIFHNNHQGVVSARNLGIKNAIGKYIIPVDADDIAEPTLIEKYVSIAEKNSNIGIVYCLYEYFDMRHGIYQLPDYSIVNMLISNCINNTSLFRRDDWIKVGGYNPNMEIGCEDYDFWLSILELGREVQLVPEVLLHYRVKQGKGRTIEIGNQRELEISRQIFENHKGLYQKYWKEVILAEKTKTINLQEQINFLFTEKYKWRMCFYKIPIIYKLVHLFK